MEKLKVENYIKFPVKFEPGCGMFFDANKKHIADVRGWGHLEKLPDAELIQDGIGFWIANAMNEQANRRQADGGGDV